MLPSVCQLLSRIYTTVAEDTPGHVELNIIPYVFFVKCPSFKLVASSCSSMLITKVLEVAFTGLVTYGTIKRMINEEHFNHAFSGVEYLL